jgi:arabinoxylan arabinofuranohydrolase
LKKLLVLVLAVLMLPTLFISETQAINPFVQNRYAADPSARFHNGQLYVYPSHDKDNPNWFDMEDYYVYCTSDLKSWREYGPVLHMNDIPKSWGTCPEIPDPTVKWMWAPDCIKRGDTYYFYFCASTNPNTNEQTPVWKTKEKVDFRVGVATSEHAYGPFTPEPYFIQGTDSVDPCVFLDDDGQAYLFWGGRNHGGVDEPRWAKLKSNMKELDGPVYAIPVNDNTLRGWYEATWVFKRNGTYYLAYATEVGNSEMRYATSTSIQGPWTYGGVILSDVVGITNHGSVVEFGTDKWYVFFHDSEMSPTDALNQRCIKFMPLTFNGTKINTVNALDPLETRNPAPTNAFQKIRAQFWSSMGYSVQSEPVDGDIGECVNWINPGDQVIYRHFYFNTRGRGGSLTVEVASPFGPDRLAQMSVTACNKALGTIDIPKTGGWQVWQKVTIPIESFPHGTGDVIFTAHGQGWSQGRDDPDTVLFNFKSFEFK